MGGISNWGSWNCHWCFILLSCKLIIVRGFMVGIWCGSRSKWAKHGTMLSFQLCERVRFMERYLKWRCFSYAPFLARFLGNTPWSLGLRDCRKKLSPLFNGSPGRDFFVQWYGGFRFPGDPQNDGFQYVSILNIVIFGWFGGTHMTKRKPPYSTNNRVWAMPKNPSFAFV